MTKEITSIRSCVGTPNETLVIKGKIIDQKREESYVVSDVYPFACTVVAQGVGVGVWEGEEADGCISSPEFPGRQLIQRFFALD